MGTAEWGGDRAGRDGGGEDGGGGEGEGGEGEGGARTRVRGSARGRRRHDRRVGRVEEAHVRGRRARQVAGTEELVLRR